MSGRVIFEPITRLPMIQPGDDLAALIYARLQAHDETLQAGDIIAIAQKVVSKSEGQLVNLADVTPSERALQIAPIAGKDPRHVEVILRESREVVWVSPGIFVVETHHGYVCANAGVDRSNIAQNSDPAQTNPENNPQHGENEWLCLLPKDANASARGLRARLKELSGVEVGVLINDTHGRPFRNGGIGTALGSAGLETLRDQRGEPDLYGYRLQATLTAVGDELAAASSLIMGQASEATPAVLIRGLAMPLPAGPDEGATVLIRPAAKDVFRYPPGSEKWRNDPK
ncbi:MAG: coenzyme F420-0:L-glutamate ligase [Chloroflexi bacterium]|nr:coenzyme F420-0:L-glutamate ligase [Chloroflexota bacterium]OJV91240.1 MAG: coenzyme F420-0:L-glutamate ligase [Chloroflexi bacterium 54-19]